MIRRTLRRSPVTILVFLALVTVAVVSGGFRGPDASFRLALATGYQQVVQDGRWWTPFTSAFLTDGGWELVVVAIAAPFLVWVAERALGSLRTALAFVVCGVLGVILGIIAQSIGVAAGELWSVRVGQTLAIDPMTPVVGALMTASAFSGRFWRGRIRVATLSSVLVFLLYSGQPSDLYRLFAALVGLALGYVLHPKDTSPLWPRSSHHETRVLVSVVIAVSALGPVVTIFNRVRLGPLAPLGLLLMANHPSTSLPSVEQCQSLLFAHGCFHSIALQRIDGAGPVLLTVLPLIALLVAAVSVLRGQRFGAGLAIVVNLALSALALLFYGFVPVFPANGTGRLNAFAAWERPLDLTICTIVPLVIAIVVLANLRHFTIRMSRRVIRWYLIGVGSALVVAAGMYLGLGWLVRDQFSPHVGIADLLADLPDRFAPVGFLRLEPLAFAPTGPAATVLYDWVGPAFWAVVVLGALAVALRPSRRIAWGHARARELLRMGGGGSLSYWSMWKGNHYWFSAEGRAAVAYRVVNGIAVTTSEPIGEHSAAVAAIPEFARFCDDNSWIAFYYGIHPDFAEACMDMGWTANIIGDETIVYPAEWNTTGKHWQDVRSSINRAEREGLTSSWTTFSALTLRQRLQIEEISELWVAEKGLPEMGFTLGGIDELRDDSVRLMVAIDAAESIAGITSWLPSFSAGRTVGWTLDFMRRTPDGPNGVMEFLIARAAEQFQGDGIEFMSLSTAPLARSASATPDNSTMARMLRYIGNRLEPVYGFQSLFNFKRKFKPQFSPIYMAYPDSLSLPTIALALARTYVPSMSVREALKFVRSMNRHG